MMISADERSLIPLVSSGGCVDLKRLRYAMKKAKSAFGTVNYNKLVIYYYNAKDKDDVMMDEKFIPIFL
jgi:hypothetical protein